MKKNLFTSESGKSYVLPFFLIACLFLLSGYTNSLLDVLNKYFQEGLGISRAQSGLVQFALYSGYFLMAIPAGMYMKARGYNKGVVMGLFVLIAGCLLFIPGADLLADSCNACGIHIIHFSYSACCLSGLEG